MIAYVDTYRDQFGVELICRTLAATDGGFLTSRGYRAAKTRPASDRQLRDAELLPVIERIYAENYGVYGARKIWRSMRREGWQIGRDQVARLMRIAGLEGVIRGRKPRTTRPASMPEPYWVRWRLGLLDSDQGLVGPLGSIVGLLVLDRG